MSLNRHSIRIFPGDDQLRRIATRDARNRLGNGLLPAPPRGYVNDLYRLGWQAFGCVNIERHLVTNEDLETTWYCPRCSHTILADPFAEGDGPEEWRFAMEVARHMDSHREHDDACRKGAGEVAA